MILYCARPVSSCNRAFTLVEIAIVLTVIGALVAGLFGLVGTMRRRTEVNQGLDELNAIVGNVRAYYAGQNVPSSSDCPSPPTSPTFGANYTAAKVFPSVMVVGGVSNNAWNRRSASATAQIGLCRLTSIAEIPAAVHFVVRYSGLTASACQDMVVRSSSAFAGMGLDQIVVMGATPTTFVTVPSHVTGSPQGATGAVDPIDATAACSADGATVDWYFSLR